VSILYWIIRKDLRVFASDKKGALMVVVVPLVLGVMMGLIFNPGSGPSPIELVVASEDEGAPVKALLARLDAEPGLEVAPMSVAEARAAVAAGEVAVALAIPAGTSDKLSMAAVFGGGANKGEVALWYDPSEPTSADIVKGLLTKAMMETVFSEFGDPSRQRAMFDELRGSVDAAARPELAAFLDQGTKFANENAAGASGGAGGGLEPPLKVTSEAVVAAGPTAGFNSHAHTFAGMLMQFLLFSASSAAKTLLAERQSGTLDRLRTTAARPWQILLGAGIANAVVALVATVVVFGVGIAVFGVELRSGLLAFGLVATGQAALVGSLVLLLVGLADSDKQIDSIGTLAILFLCFVSGAWVPSFMLPEALLKLGPAIPTRWILDGMAGATWRGLGMGHAALSCGVLLAFSAVFATVGLRRFRWS